MKVWKLIQRFITGKASLVERLQLQRWINQHPDNKRIVRQLEQIWELTPEEELEVDVQQAWERFNQQIILKKSKKGSSPRQKYPDKWLYIWRIAALILVGFVAGYLIQYYQPSQSSSGETSQFYAMQNLTTGKGEKAKVTFSDGTEVLLNTASSLQFPNSFTGLKREVYLDGEAYFKVAHDPAHPFVVHVQGTEVQVLGTAFNIRGWREDSSVEVAVREGRVSVSSSNNSEGSSNVVLRRGQFTRVKEGREPTPAMDVDIKNYLVWTRGGLHFNNVPFRDVIKRLEREFDVQISVTDTKMLDVPYTSTFEKGKLDKILRIVAASMEMEYSREGEDIIFK